MQYLLLLVLLLPARAFAQAGSAPYPARILDASQLFANYRWGLDVSARNTLRDAFGDSLAAVIVERTQEVKWPDGFKSIQDREENRNFFCDLKAYYLGNIAPDKALLRIPAAENRHLPSPMQSREDWFLIIREKAVENLKNSSSFPHTLESQIPFLLEDCVQGFSNSMETEDSLHEVSLDGRMVKARFLLEGARSSMFVRSPEGARIAHFSVFTPTPFKEEATRQYQDILQRISAMYFKSCPMAKQRESVLADGSRTNTFLAFDYSGDMKESCKGLTLEIRLLPSYAQSGSEPVWFVQLALFRQ